MEWLLTACSLAAAVFAFVAARRAAAEADNARDECLSLRKSAAKLAAHDLSLDNLHTQFKRLNGRMNAYSRRGPHADEEAIEGQIELPVANGLDPDLAAELAFQGAPVRAEPSRGA